MQKQYSIECSIDKIQRLHYFDIHMNAENESEQERTCDGNLNRIFMFQCEKTEVIIVQNNLTEEKEKVSKEKKSTLAHAYILSAC